VSITNNIINSITLKIGYKVKKNKIQSRLETCLYFVEDIKYKNVNIMININ
jgi:hypothetical protein